MTGHANFLCLIRGIESDTVDKSALPLGARNHSGCVPVKDHDFRVDLIGDCQADHVVVSLSRKVEVDYDLRFSVFVVCRTHAAAVGQASS